MQWDIVLCVYMSVVGRFCVFLGGDCDIEEWRKRVEEKGKLGEVVEVTVEEEEEELWMIECAYCLC